MITDVQTSSMLAEAVKPWSYYNGPLPDDDHPLRCVFESGIQYTVNLLAKELGVTDYTPCEGTEEFDGDLGGTLMNIVCAALPEDAGGDQMQVCDVHIALFERDAEIAKLRKIVTEVRAQFDFYAQEHRKAGKHEKAATNERFAFLCSEALAHSDGSADA